MTADPTLTTATPQQEAERDVLHRYVLAGIKDTAATYAPLEEVQALIDAGDATGAGNRLHHLYVEQLGYRQYDSHWSRPLIHHIGGVQITDAWLIATVTTPLMDRRYGTTVLPTGLKVLVRAERNFMGHVEGYSVYSIASARILGRVAAWHLDAGAAPSTTGQDS